MLFPTHLLVAYAIGRRWDVAPLMVVTGAALPDVIDKSIGTVGLLARYQSVGHSLLAIAALFVVVFVRRRWTPLWIGWASHLLLDAIHMLLNGRSADILFLAWPVIDHEPSVTLGPIAFARQYVGTPSFYVEIAIWLGVGVFLLTEGRERP